MILEVALLDVIADKTHESEKAFAEASEIVSSAPGYLSHELQRCIETLQHRLRMLYEDRCPFRFQTET